MLTGIILFASWNDMPTLVITHIGMGISYGSKNILPMLFCVELMVMFFFTLRYDIPLIREMRKIERCPQKFVDVMAIIMQMVAVVILSLFVLLAVVQ